MNFDEINALRAAVHTNTVVWAPDANKFCKIVAVSDHMVDPENTGVKDFTAYLDTGGYLDLSNTSMNDIKILAPLRLPDGDQYIVNISKLGQDVAPSDAIAGQLAIPGVRFSYVAKETNGAAYVHTVCSVAPSEPVRGQRDILAYGIAS